MSSNALLLLVHETLSLDLGVQTLAGLHGQHKEAVFSANWFSRHALPNNTLLSVLTRVNAETRKGCQSVIASAHCWACAGSDVAATSPAIPGG